MGHRLTELAAITNGNCYFLLIEIKKGPTKFVKYFNFSIFTTNFFKLYCAFINRNLCLSLFQDRQEKHNFHYVTYPNYKVYMRQL